MAILSALFGIGVGAFRSFSRPERTATSQVKDAMRQARLFARTEGVPASVVVAPERATVQTVGLRTVGNWHFEDLEGSGWPVDASYVTGRLVVSDVLGTALELDGDARLEVPSPPGSFDSPHGFGVDVYLQPVPAVRPMTLLERPGSWKLELDREDVLQVVLYLEELEDARLLSVEGESVEDTTGDREREPLAFEEFRHGVPAAALSAETLTRLTIVFDGRTLRVAVDGARVEADTRFEVPRRLITAPRLPLHSGDTPTHFRGRIDELRVASVVKGEPQLLPEEVLLDGVEQVIHVDPLGHLDPAWHRTPVQVGFTYGLPLRRTVVEFGLLGTVRSWDEDADARPASTDGELSDEDGDTDAAEQREGAR